MKKNFLIEKNNIYNEDCKKIIKLMIDQKFFVDAIITDPPYNISRKNNFKTINRSGIDFGKWDKDFNQIDWLNNIDKILKPGGSIIIFNDWKNLGIISNKLEEMDFEIKDIIRWIKPSPMPRNINRRYVTDYEFAIWAVKKGKKWVFNKLDNISYLRPEYKFSPPMGKNRFHPTQKPHSLIKALTHTHTHTQAI